MNPIRIACVAAALTLSSRAVAAPSSKATAVPAAASIRVEWARPFLLAQPEPWPMSKDQPLFSEGILIQLRVDPALLVPRQVGGLVPYAGERPVFTFNWDYVGGCLVAMVPGPVDLATIPLFFGSPELPERVDAERGRTERAIAEQNKVLPPDSASLVLAFAAGGPALLASDLREVHRIAMEQVASCTATPEDRMRPGIPDNFALPTGAR